MDLSIFRIYDIRGTCPEQINSEVIYRIARNFNKVFDRGSNIVIGYDARISSPNLFEVMSVGLKVAGMRVVKIGHTTTPMITFFANSKAIDGGIMITASHNPMTHNGVKVIRKNHTSQNKAVVEKISGKEILKIIGTKNIHKDIDISKMLSAPLSELGKKKDYVNRYVSFMLKRFSVAKKINIAFVAQSSLIADILKDISEKIDKLTTIKLDTSDNQPKDIGASIVKEHADIGVVFDVDGDRSTFIDDKGRVVRAEYICQLLITRFGYKAFVSDTISQFLSDILASNLKNNNSMSVKAYTSKVGGVFVSKKMAKYDVDMGFEYSNHYYFKDFWNADSGIISTLMVIDAVSKLPYKLSDFVDFLPHTERIDEIEICINKAQIKKKYKQLEKKYKRTAIKINHNDGLTIYFKDAWFNIRASNTQNVLRLNIEAYSKNRVAKLKKEILLIIK